MGSQTFICEAWLVLLQTTSLNPRRTCPYELGVPMWCTSKFDWVSVTMNTSVTGFALSVESMYAFMCRIYMKA